MQIHNIKRKTPNKKVMIVGRGGKRGKTSGRGGKGQTARAGHKARPEWRDFIKRMPKLRGQGFHALHSIENYNHPVVAINLDLINAAFKDGATVKPSTLFARGVIEQYKGKNQKIKILSSGEIKKKITLVGCTVSASAKEKIEKAGGSVK